MLGIGSGAVKRALAEDGPRGRSRPPPAMISAMSLPEDVLEKLACPRCREPLHLREEGAALHCEACRLRYAIGEDGIANLLEDEAEPLDAAAPETHR